MPVAAVHQEIAIRDLESIADLRQIEFVEKAAWGVSDRDVLPLPLLVACREAGTILVGAFDQNHLVGFAFGVLGRVNSGLVFHSHELAVLPPYRGSDIGYKLKLAQRERALQLGIPVMTWTFDPLQCMNAHFNFAKLGAWSTQYRIDFYGARTSSFLHVNGTDRLLVEWAMSSERVKRRISQEEDHTRTICDCATSGPPIVSMGANTEPLLKTSGRALGELYARVAIPANIDSIIHQAPALAMEWRLATRRAFTDALAAGFVVWEFQRPLEPSSTIGTYLLARHKL